MYTEYSVLVTYPVFVRPLFLSWKSFQLQHLIREISFFCNYNIAINRIKQTKRYMTEEFIFIREHIIFKCIILCSSVELFICMSQNCPILSLCICVGLDFWLLRVYHKLQIYFNKIIKITMCHFIAFIILFKFR